MSTGSAQNTAEIRDLAKRARVASLIVAKAPSSKRQQALLRMAERLEAAKSSLIAANKLDLEAGQKANLAPAMLDRLMLDEKRIAGMAKSLREIAAQADPIGEMTKLSRRPNGLVVGRMRIPLGVICMIYEARPNVTADAAGLCLKSGNAVILRGGSEAVNSNRAIAAELRAAIKESDLPEDAVALVPTTDRTALETLLACDEDIDLCIPRGGEGLIRFVSEHARMPVIRHYKGNCHVYVDKAADIGKAIDICENAKVSRPGVCNAAETILVHEAVAPIFLPRLAERLANVELRGDDRVRRILPSVKAATDEDFHTEFLDLICAVGVVESTDAAIAHIEKYGSSHTEAIVTEDYATARRFMDEVGSSTVCVNASTRFADGGELGLGAEIGISTSKLHAYGPMGAEELTTSKFVVLGTGQVRA